MHGIGNDYVVIDNRNEQLPELKIPIFTRRICKRRFSVGADGLLLVYNSTIADLKMRMFNPDGTEAEMCGNGLRCFVKFCYENGIISKDELTVETLAGVRHVWLNFHDSTINWIKVDMGVPLFEKPSIPMVGTGQCINEPLTIGNQTFQVTCLSIGNPHCVLFVDNLEVFPVKKVGPKIETHTVFPNRTNVEFVQIVDRDEIRVRVWERGVGETLACGTGACASMVASYIQKKTNENVTVHLLGGNLEISYSDNVFLKGPAAKVYYGELWNC